VRWFVISRVFSLAFLSILLASVYVRERVELHNITCEATTTVSQFFIKNYVIDCPSALISIGTYTDQRVVNSDIAAAISHEIYFIVSFIYGLLTARCKSSLSDLMMQICNFAASIIIFYFMNIEINFRHFVFSLF